MAFLLFPGRHHLLTQFQLEYMTLVTSGDPRRLIDVNGAPLGLNEPIDTVLWAVTSANHSNTRRNPLPAHRREVAIEAFSAELEAESFVYMIDDIGASPRFGQYVIKKIEVESQGRFRLTPENTVVGCSTPEVIALYERMGFRILPFELSDRQKGIYRAETPWQLLMGIVASAAAGRDWRREEAFLTQVSRATRSLYLKYNYGDVIASLHADALLTEDGDITETRNYNTYSRAFDDGARRKFELVRGLIVPGKIVDIGCCTGSILREMTLEEGLRESDFYGIEVARPLFAECLHRKEQGMFANENVFFYQRDFTGAPIFPAASVHTFTTFSLTHEVESYHGRETLMQFMRLLFDQLVPGGRWLNVDVVGPADRDRPVLMWLNAEDGRADDYEREFPPTERETFAQYLEGLCTLSRFLRFARDFRREEGYRLSFERRAMEGKHLVRLRLEDACEFLSKKDYTDNWHSEMHERFCFWSFAEWTQAAEQAGFRVHSTSREYLNPWIVEHRYAGKVALFADESTLGEPLAFPPSNMVLVAEKQ